MAATVVYKPLDGIVPGECLARDVLDDQGNVLLEAGAPLDAQGCRRLRVCGISAVPVDGAKPVSDEAGARNTLDRSLDHLFRHWRTSPGMKHLRALLARHRREGPRQ